MKRFFRQRITLDEMWANLVWMQQTATLAAARGMARTGPPPATPLIPNTQINPDKPQRTRHLA
ncbi:hypothetical protein ACFSQE_15580 [Vogesella fluminis]|uniref:Uncharacterized protein n=1 Tax=Vogesella fluminis TaxID=1069161 RepID=A0ABQ3H7K4_9NEIS|nr:hypothetical protein [Vogesella fluminis]GHD72730.1 hypothetical protein GCM10011419_06380 [Vogesella fluminis]